MARPTLLADLDPLLQKIAQAHTHSDDESITETAIIASVNYLEQLPPEIHWLCNSSPLLPVLVQAIQLWGYGEPPAQATLAKFKPMLATSLSRCPDCAVEWHLGFRKELKRVFTEVYSYDDISTAEFYTALDQWDAERVGSGLRNAIEIVGGSSMSWKNSEVKGPLVESLASPGLLLREEVFKLWKELFSKLDKIPVGIGNIWLPGALILLFDSDADIREFAEQMFKKRDHKINTQEFDSDFRVGLETIITRGLKKINDRDFEAADRLWNAINLLLRSSEPSLIQTSLTSPPFNLRNLLISHLSTSGPHFLIMLTALSQFLQIFSSGFWQHISITASNLIDVIFSNPSFEDILTHPHSHLQDGDLSVLLDWLPPFMATQSEHAKVQIVSKILFFFFESFSHTHFPETSRSFCLGEGLRLLRNIMENGVEDHGLVDRDVDLTLKLDVIQCVDKYAEIIIRTARTGDARATRVLGLRLSLDCQLLEDEMKELIKPDEYRGGVAPTLKLAELWSVVEDQDWTEDDSNLIRAVLASLGRVATFDLLDPKNFETKDVERVKGFTKAVSEIQRLMLVMFNKMIDIRPRVMRSILEDEETCTSVVLHLFNAKRVDLERADLDMLKTTFDVSGKEDLWKQLLRISFQPSLASVCQVMLRVLGLQKIPPTEKLRKWHRGFLVTYVGKIVHQSMQVVELLCSGRSGILTTTDILSQSDSHKSILQTFWRTFWKILNISFVSATSWAVDENKDVMLNFLRYVLEAAAVLFDAFKCMDSTLSGSGYVDMSPVKATRTQQTLLMDVQTPLQSLSKWLTLSVDDLRETTLTLAIKILKRFARAEVQVHKDTIIQYYRLAYGKKKNNMSEEQRERLLFALSEHDVEPAIRKVVEALASAPSSGYTTPTASEDIQTTPALAKIKPREIIDITNDEYLRGDLSDSEISSIMDQFEKKSQKSGPLKQTKLDFTRAKLKPPGLSNSTSTTSTHSKSHLLNQKASSAVGQANMAQLKADFRTERQRIPVSAKAHRKPVAPPATDGFGRPLNAAGYVTEPPRLPPKKIEESSTSEAESDDEDDGLFAIRKDNKSPPKVRKVEKRHVQLLGGPVQSRVSLRAREHEARRVASERNIRARLEPDLTPLLKRVLGWAPGHTGTLPPGMKQTDFKQVEARYLSPHKYEDTFEPLLMLECWQHIQQAKSESLGETFDFVIDNRQTVDEYIDLFVSMKNTVYANVGLLDPDLVILSNRQGKGGKECFAKVQGVKKKKDTVELTLRCLPSTDTAAVLVPKATIFGVKLFSLTPILREYGALKGLPYYELVEEILAARPSVPVKPTNRELKFTMDTYAVNEPQAAAIVGACQSEGFSLIQGPPGTGKTKTILGMVGAFLTGNAKPGATSISIPGQEPLQPPQKSKLLLCAPSNAAVDEIVLRLIGGIRNARGQRYYPSIVRVGRSDSINPHVREVTLDELVEKRLQATAPKPSEKGAMDEQNLRTKLNKILDLRNAKSAEYDRARETGVGDIAALASQLRELNAEKNRIGAQLDDQKDKRFAMMRDSDVNRRQITFAILDEADLICCTLSGSGHDQLAKMKVNFETVIIDEAAQSIELAALIPLKYGCQRCILVGDPNQLPPTVLSQAAAKFQYEESLFVRMQRNHPKSIYLLSIQYRMNPEISRFPSDKFYEGKLIDGPEVSTTTAREWHQSILFRPYRFFNVYEGAQEHGKKGESLMNKAEVAIAMSIVDRLRADYDHIDFDGKVGIVTPYKEQLRELLRQFRRRYGSDITNSVDFNTIDGFQGQEKDIIILSCVRAAQNQGVGFLRDVRRINVALTRAKSTLMILGNKAALVGNEFWRDLILDAEERGLLMDCGSEAFDSRPPPVGSNSQITSRSRGRPIAKRKENQPMGELIPLGTKSVSSGKKAPNVVNSDVEMVDAYDSSDASGSSSEDMESKDVEMVDVHAATLPTQSSLHQPTTSATSNAKFRNAMISRLSKTSTDVVVSDSIESTKKPKKRRKLERKESPKLPSESNKLQSTDSTSNDAVEPDKSVNKAPKGLAVVELPNAPVYKRKAGPANLFIKQKKPLTTAVENRTTSSDKKESVKQRLARQLVTPLQSSPLDLIGNSVDQNNNKLGSGGWN